VRVLERSGRVGGQVPAAAAGAGRRRLTRLTDWLAAECRELGVTVETGVAVDPAGLAALVATDERTAVVVCTGSLDGRPGYQLAAGTAAPLSAAALLGALAEGTDPLADRPDGPVVVIDPVGGPVGVSVAETLAGSGRPVHLVTPDHIAGNELARTGDLAPANVRLQQAGVVIERRSVVRSVAGAAVEVEDRFTGARRTIEAAVVVDAGFRLPDDRLWEAGGGHWARAGDAVAPRSLLEALLEARRAVLALETAEAAPRWHQPLGAGDRR